MFKMKVNIPIWQIKENISGVRVEKMNEDFISSLYDDITRLHRNDHFICIMLTSGSAEILVDFKRVQVVPGRIVFLFPGQIQRAIKFDDDVDGWILFLDSKMVDEHARQMIEDSLFKGPVLPLQAADMWWFIQYFELLLQTYKDDTLGSLHKSAVNAFATPFVYKIASAFQANTESASGQQSQRSIELTKEYKRLVRKHFLEMKKPSDYAGLMRYSISYLNDTVKAVTGFTSSYFIQQEMLRESQRLLCYTDLSIKEISAHLGYEDPKYFNRIFTKLAGTPPGRFRINFKSLKV